MRPRSLGALTALPLVLALTLTGCGGDGDDGGVASAGGAGQGTKAAASPSMNRDEMGQKFAECMRKNGVHMDDPKPGEGIQLKLDRSVTKETADKAMEACRQYNPAQNSAGGPDPKMEERNRKFAECMRANGVEKWPDPKPGQVGHQIGPEVGDDPDLQTAQGKCRSILSQGTGR
ncbi:hypothetical protein GCM10009678_68010 [Actinomadura kijaniata]|uniref:Lipoprotein n=1 Tax=Actinomadura namibiensis TaxID=182080 RepID=A0A7W3LM79_ACTNM|nr:hypothetical protein [Actinomadura namibiensis]MBA8950735.1 hypothetical protein [Actinomadura namibiensis]